MKCSYCGNDKFHKWTGQTPREYTIYECLACQRQTISGKI